MIIGGFLNAEWVQVSESIVHDFICSIKSRPGSMLTVPDSNKIILKSGRLF